MGSMTDRLSFHLAAEPPRRLDKALARDVPEAGAHGVLSRSRLARLIAEGAVRVDGRVETDPAAPVRAGAAVEIALAPPEAARTEAQPIALRVVWEDGDLIVVDKPAGMVVHPAPGSRDGTLVNALMHHCGEALSGIGGVQRPGIVHRIDKDTSGLLVAAKTDRAHRGLAARFAAHDVERAYLALCHGVPDPADARLAGLPGVAWEAGGVLRIALPLGRHPTDRQRQAVRPAGGRHAVTRARVLERLGGAALLECRLETGRTHQIRVHLAHVGHPLIGDPVYGGRRRLPAAQPGAQQAEAFPRQALHAATLGFVHPVMGERLRFESPLPPDLAELVAALRG
ncbi:RluA family pseudouridine synthase [Rubellimicrobium sp. CFH 75288]|uniref:RluA family pseudouridine synthase n=1 Tax=Rubellimicrobium sp. CFH 75288 TaxID=2697034 RepID=UPI0014120314|nr:RluA family pseudouridine synthase [Rubellimicrobium sp. CFH 75288]NAZ37474.1 RluA family pseudouridine synthase [Rubellimicrobium sp. CFH 75288]